MVTNAITDSDMLREYLMAPHPMQRAIALHALEVEVEHGAAPARIALAGAAARFAARGIPFYAVNDAHYRAWVTKAVTYWQRLHCQAAPAVRVPASPQTQRPRA